MVYRNFTKYLFNFSVDIKNFKWLGALDLKEMLAIIIPDCRLCYVSEDNRDGFERAVHAENDGLSIYNWDGAKRAVGWLAFDKKYEKQVNNLLAGIFNKKYFLYLVKSSDIKYEYGY